jgi:general secretion pathway protein A
MYTQFYRLHGEPFLLTPDHRFYFESSVHSQAMSHLTYGISRGEGFIVITGEIGAGKTTLVKRLCATIDAQRILTAHVVTTQLEGVDLLRMVAAAFGLKDLPSDKSSLLLRLQTFFEACLLHNYRTLLIVDEAQNLPVSGLEELRMLSNFQAKDVAPFQSFLIGQPQFRSVLSNPDLEQLRQRVIATYHLGPMNRQECGEYLIHRLQQVGWRSDPSFEPGAVDAIYDHTGGIPRRINTLCNRLLLYGYLDDLHHFSANDVNKVAADLATEMSTQRSNGNGVATLPVNGEMTESGIDLPDRLHRLEQRVARQEEFMKRAAWIVRDLLAFQQSDTE